MTTLARTVGVPIAQHTRPKQPHNEGFGLPIPCPVTLYFGGGADSAAPLAAGWVVDGGRSSAPATEGEGSCRTMWAAAFSWLM